MKVLVTGGGGFLGSAIVRRLVDRGDSVRILARGAYPELEAAGVECMRGDIANAVVVSHAVEGCDLVIHTAAKAGVWGPHEEYVLANVVGTDNVLDACIEHGVRKLVYTSSPSLTFAGKDQDGVDESVPIPEIFLSSYPETKAEAERHVLAANGPGLATVALRPHLIFGPGDPHLSPRIVDRAKKGRLRIVGTGRYLVDMTYVDNAADAHILAADRLGPGSPIAGKAYFISNDEPGPIGDLINAILAAADVPPVTRHISNRTAYGVGALLEGIWRLFGIGGEPPMTRFVALQLGTAHWFDITAAKRDLGYEAKVSMAEGMARLGESLRGR
jgi:nucleoside-diphosphate-sugar epimerase